MDNFILILLFVMLLLSYISGATPLNSTTFQCGIWAFLAKDPKKFNEEFLWKFHILGMANDPRGGDGAGVLFDKVLTHVSGKKYFDLMQKYMLTAPNNHNVVLGHTRKASSGGKNIEYTQPFALKENGLIKGAAIHNGTLHNHDALAKKYKVPKNIYYDKTIKNFKPNDTQILAYILIELEEFDVLSQYSGAAAIVWENREKNRSYLFKGASPKYNNKMLEERPLYTYKSEKGIWVSSIDDPLYAIASELKPEIEEVPENKVLVIESGKIVDEISINRSKATQASASYDGWDEYPGYGFGYYEDYLEDKRSKATYDSTLVINRSGNVNNSITVSKPTITCKSLSERVADEFDGSTSYNIDYNRSRYYFNGKLATGIFHLDEYGYIEYQEGESIPKGAEYTTLYLIDGIRIDGLKNYNEATIMYAKVKSNRYLPAFCNKDTSMEFKVIKTLAFFSKYPVTDISSNAMFTWKGNKKTDSLVPFSGDFIPLYSNYKYKFENGTCKAIIKLEVILYSDKPVVNDKFKLYHYYKSKKNLCYMIYTKSDFAQRKHDPCIECLDNDDNTVYLSNEDAIDYIQSSYEEWKRLSKNVSKNKNRDINSFFKENQYYSLKGDDDYVVKITNINKLKAINVNNETIEVKSPAAWKASTKDKFNSVKKEIEEMESSNPEDDEPFKHMCDACNGTGLSINGALCTICDGTGTDPDNLKPDEFEWQNELIGEAISKELEKVNQAINNIETEVFNNSALEISKEGHRIVEDLREVLSLSKFNN